MKELESDANQVLKFMASNGLIANAKKTAFLIINQKPASDQLLTIQIGKVGIVQEKSAKLLGMTFEGNLKWTEHIYGSGGLISNLNQRLFFIRRLKNHVGKKALMKISDSLFMSKIRYGLQLLGSVRWSSTDSTCQDLEAIQKCQNKLLRVLNGSRISDRISTKSMLKSLNMLSVNQINAQIKLTEMWKSTHIANYPIKPEPLSRSEAVVNTRAVSQGQLIEVRQSNTSQNSFLNDAIHIWNKAPSNIKQCIGLFAAKKAIKIFVSSLPI